MKIACWSGPRNISTALMRSWSSRKDTFVSDEPFYAYFGPKFLAHLFQDHGRHYELEEDIVSCDARADGGGRQLGQLLE